MSITEWNDSEFGQTWTWLQERSKANKHRRDEVEELYFLNRLNTFYLISAWAKGLHHPSDLYELPSDKEAVKGIKERYNPFTPEAEEAFAKMDRMVYKDKNTEFLKEVEWQARQQ